MTDLPSAPRDGAAEPVGNEVPVNLTDAAFPVAVPALSLVVLVGMSSSGKSTFARTHFAPTEIVSSDACRAMVGDDENDQSVTAEAFDLLHTIVDKRLALGRLTVVDATNLRREDRRSLIDVARRHHVLPVAIAFDVPRWVCERRNVARPDRHLPPAVLGGQYSLFRGSIGRLEREGFRRVIALRGEREIDRAVLVREPLWTDKRHLPGPFDIIGDIHGCHQELVDLLRALGYTVDTAGTSAFHPGGRMAAFVGDLVDRGPAIPSVLRLVMSMVSRGSALCVPGNHENKLLKALRGRSVKINHGLQESLDQLALEPEQFRDEVTAFLDGLISHAVLDAGRLVVVHAGLPELMHNRSSGAVRSFCLYGDTTGETDGMGFPVRYPWADDYTGRAMVVYGHTPVTVPTWVNNTMCVDTGCVFGGSLTALRYPERELVAVPAGAVYYRSSVGSPGSLGSLGSPGSLGVAAGDGSIGAPRRESMGSASGWGASGIDLARVTGKYVVQTDRYGPVTLRDDQTAAALEVMSRFAVDPRRVPYLPPTMAPAPTSSFDNFLEHPAEAFRAYRDLGINALVGEEKHMGSRAVLLLGREPGSLHTRFGLGSELRGSVITRTARAFFADAVLEGHVVAKLSDASEVAGLWQELNTEWLLLDAEILPWSAKALELIRQEYAPVAAAGRAFGAAAETMFAAAAERNLDLATVRDRVAQRTVAVDAFAVAYGQYCWPVDGLDGLRIAPFQLLASAHEVLALRPHPWHMEVAERLASAAPDLVRTTRWRTVHAGDPRSEADAVAWWLGMVDDGGEGMVVKPAEGIVGRGRDLAQAGLKVRGPEYLRLIYGPDYREPGRLRSLRSRSLGHKRSLALRELALGLEGLDRLVRGASLTAVHACAFGVLALETEPVDPRL